MNTEMNCTVGTPQYKFMESDLVAVKRSLTPWIVFAGHRPMYSSADNTTGFDLDNGPWWPDVEALLVAHSVDL